ncbi:MAG TPA: universal stress protein [Usitatibacter sp.]|jgi:nucleotide-binding universal stress UspA family protein|nr:universal stress protein [Usitatibacter sp.]
MYKRILLAYDGSQSGQKALLECREVAGLSNAELFLIAVSPPAAALIGGEGYVYDARAEEEERKAFQRILDDGMSQLKQEGRGVVQGEVVVGQPVDEITQYARRIQADLIVVGHRHLDSWAARWWRGSISKALIEHAPCSVLVAITR